MYAICVTALWSYDYLLTFEDEVAHVWGHSFSRITPLFVITRYLPFLDAIALLVRELPFASSPVGNSGTNRCVSPDTHRIELHPSFQARSLLVHPFDLPSL